MTKNANYPIPANEISRLKALYQYELLDTFSEDEYDFITKMASQICGAQASLITLIDDDRQFVKSCFGFEIRETPREISFCNYTIMDPHNINEVPDMRLDDRYNKNPLVTGQPNAVFYAGAPLVTPQGYVLGSICVLDAMPKELTHDQKEALKALAQQTITTMELRKKNKDLKLTKTKLQKTNKELKEYVKLVSHDMKTPLANITMLSKGFRRNFGAMLDEHSGGYIELIENSASGLIEFIDGMLVKTKNHGIKVDANKTTDTLSVLKKVIKLVAPTEDIKINIKGSFPSMPIDEIALQQVFQNLITNAIKYNDKPKGIITIIADSDTQYHYFNICDNGSGIAHADLAKIFKDEQTLNKTDRYGNKGTGIGLAKVKNIVESLGGNIKVASELKKGTDFKVCIPLYTNIFAAI